MAPAAAALVAAVGDGGDDTQGGGGGVTVEGGGRGGKDVLGSPKNGHMTRLSSMVGRRPIVSE